MTDCRKEGKDEIIFATKENHEQPSTVTLGEPEQQLGPINVDGTINWNCPCLEGMATGPCGLEIKEAFSCYIYGEEEMKGSDCLEKQMAMQMCMYKYPSVYVKYLNKNDKENNDDLDRKPGGPAVSQPDETGSAGNKEVESNIKEKS